MLKPIYARSLSAAGLGLLVALTAVAAKADILMLSELFLTGYFPDDLLFKPKFIADAMQAARDLVADTAGTGVVLILPTVWLEKTGLHNAVVVAEDGKIIATRHKRELPNTDVFFEKRYFTPGPPPEPVLIKGVPIGIPICEDIWHPSVCEHLAMRGAEIMLCPNGSPYWTNKQHVRKDLVRARVAEDDVPMLYLNQVGGQDELVFDGASFVLNGDRTLAVQLPAWREAVVTTEWARSNGRWACAEIETAAVEEGDAAAYAACMLGLRDYVKKNGFPGVVLGLSGGIDSALVAAMAVDALGPAKVHAVMLPSRYTSDESITDATDCARLLGIRYDKVAIEPAVAGVTWVLKDLFAGTSADITEENIQSRVRGTLLMAISNKFGHMVVTTGNKSEMSVGYATLYGDMNGGFNPIKDLYKMEVYRLSRWRNENTAAGGLGPRGRVIPERILTKAPSAELRAGQTDQDSLPPYEVLDDILAALVEGEMPLTDIVAKGHAPETVLKVDRLLRLAEYKRRQAAPGVKISARAFGRERRYPITNKFREEIAVDAVAWPKKSEARVAAPRPDGGEG